MVQVALEDLVCVTVDENDLSVILDSIAVYLYLVNWASPNATNRVNVEFFYLDVHLIFGVNWLFHCVISLDQALYCILVFLSELVEPRVDSICEPGH